MNGFPGSSAGKESTHNAENPGSIIASGRSLGEGIGYPLQYYWASLVAQLVKDLPCNAGDLGSIPGLGRPPGEGNEYPFQYSDWRTPWTIPWVAKSQTWLTDFHSLSFFHTWEEGPPPMAQCKESTCNSGDTQVGLIPWVGKIPWRKAWQPTTHSNILAWRIPWTEKPRGLQSMGSLGHDLKRLNMYTHPCENGDKHSMHCKLGWFRGKTTTCIKILSSTCAHSDPADSHLGIYPKGTQSGTKIHSEGYSTQQSLECKKSESSPKVLL